MHLSSFPRRLSTVALTLSLTVMGCSDDGDTDTPQVVRAAVLTDTRYFDYDPLNIGSEASNLIFTLEDAEYDVFGVSTVSRDSIVAALAAADVLVIPEQERDVVNDTLIAHGTDTLIANWVRAGGVLVSSYEWYHLNSMFDWDIHVGPAAAGPFLRGPRGKGTPFAGAPDELEDNDATDQIDVASLPAGALAPWRNASNEAVLFAVPVGQGWVVWLGYDWYDAAPFGEQDGGWIETLGRVRRFVPTD